MNNISDVMISMGNALRKMGDACDKYESEEHETAYKLAVQSSMIALYALRAFVNDYPYSRRAFDEVNRIHDELDKLRDNYDTYLDDDDELI